ncbi:RloB family protein [Streptomyces sp. NPDC090053]|uniref:RloB family protein n=1 Tax=Streptomyces sp. NPDC090053 TaxID=3365932 RepID=UPI003804135F
MGRGKPLGRTKGARPEQRRFLIYSEGECTEDQYFRGLRGDLRALPVNIQIGGVHGEPKSLVRAAIAHKERAVASAAVRFTAYDEVWCVVDVEAPRAHASLDEALTLASRSGVQVALTNPCFELWVLLHFAPVTGYCTSGAVQKALEGLGSCGYTTSRKHLDYERLRDRHEQARERAVELRRRGTNGRSVNPWTEVDRLVDLLKAARAKR